MSQAPSCPICSKPLSPDYRPFCSKRCADIDLSRWLKGVYAIPASKAEDEESESNDESGPPDRA